MTDNRRHFLNRRRRTGDEPLRRRRRTGFTQVEFLVTIGIIAILLGIVTPGIVTIMRNMKMAKLDNIAKDIYTSAQYQLVTLKAGGELEQDSFRDGDGHAAIYVSDEEDPDAGPKKLGDDEHVVAYLTNPGAHSALLTNSMLPLGSIDDTVRSNGFYLVEYNPYTAMVRGVFYWEESGDFDTTKYQSLSDRSRDNRDGTRSASVGPVGYYDGGDVERVSGESQELQIEVINNDELYVKITPQINNGLFSKGEISLVVSDTNTGAEKTPIRFQNNAKDQENTDANPLIWVSGADLKEGESAYYKLRLDALVTNLRFCDLYSHTNQDFVSSNTDYASGKFLPGCDIGIAATFTEAGKLAKTVHATTNSLFAARGSMDGTTGGTDTSCAFIAYGRHLQNLHVAWADPKKENSGHHRSDANSLRGVTSAILSAEKVDWKLTMDTVKANNGIENLSFRPIINTNLQTFDGQNNKIYNLLITGNVISKVNLEGDDNATNKVGAGLFSYFNKDSIENVNLVNLNIREPRALDGTAPNYIGGICGFLWNFYNKATISHCQVYAEAPDGGSVTEDTCVIRDTSNNLESVGGLIGSSKSKNNPANEISYSSASQTAITIQKDTYIGGLIGYMEKAKISNCYADIGVRTDTADGSIWSGGITCKSKDNGQGGLFGSAAYTDSTVSDCYVTGYMEKGGFAITPAVSWSNFTVTLTRCYAAVMTKDRNNRMQGDYIPIEEYAPAANMTATAAKKLSLTKENGNNTNYIMIPSALSMTPPDGLTRLDYAGIRDLALPGDKWRNADTDTTYRYGITYEDTYPFPKLADINHYGDWPEMEVATHEMEMAYYELYRLSNGTYEIAFYNEDLNLKELWTQEELDAQGADVVADGYSVLFHIGSDNKFLGLTMGQLLEGNGQNYITETFVMGSGEATRQHLKNRTYEALKDSNQSVIQKRLTHNGDLISDAQYYLQVKNYKYLALFLSGEECGMAARDKGYTADSNDYYQYMKVSVNLGNGGSGKNKMETTFWYNPYFAKSKIGIDTKPKDATVTGNDQRTVYIRTERQFATLASDFNTMKSYGKTNDFCFIQELNLDYQNYQYSTTMVGDGLEENLRKTISRIDDFKSTYDGNGHFLIPEDNRSRSLTSLNGGTLQNWTVKNARNMQLEQNNGIFSAANTNGTIQNCTVYDCQGRITNTGLISGPMNGGLITDCKVLGVSDNQRMTIPCNNKGCGITNEIHNGGVVKNTIVRYLDMETTDYDCALGVGILDDGTMDNVTVEYASLTGRYDCGALAGRMESGTLKDSSASHIRLTMSDNDGDLVGLAAGELKSGTISGVTVSSSSVTGRNACGGLVGQLTGGTLKSSSVSNVTVTGTVRIGGACGHVKNEENLSLADLTVDHLTLTSAKKNNINSNSFGDFGVGGVIGVIRVEDASKSVSIGKATLQNSIINVNELENNTNMRYNAGLFAGAYYQNAAAEVTFASGDGITVTNNTLEMQVPNNIQHSQSGLGAVFGAIRAENLKNDTLTLPKATCDATNTIKVTKAPSINIGGYAGVLNVWSGEGGQQKDATVKFDTTGALAAGVTFGNKADVSANNHIGGAFGLLYRGKAKANGIGVTTLVPIDKTKTLNISQSLNLVTAGNHVGAFAGRVADSGQDQNQNQNPDLQNSGQISLTDFRIAFTSAVKNAANLGGFVGLMDTGIISGVTTEGTLTSEHEQNVLSGTGHIGGLLGSMTSGSITGTTAATNAATTGQDDVGGFLGYLSGTTQNVPQPVITACTSAGSLVGGAASKEARTVGGFVGEPSTDAEPHISQCTSTVNVSSQSVTKAVDSGQTQAYALGGFLGRYEVNTPSAQERALEERALEDCKRLAGLLGEVHVINKRGGGSVVQEENRRKIPDSYMNLFVNFVNNYGNAQKGYVESYSDWLSNSNNSTYKYNYLNSMFKCYLPVETMYASTYYNSVLLKDNTTFTSGFGDSLTIGAEQYDVTGWIYNTPLLPDGGFVALHSNSNSFIWNLQNAIIGKVRLLENNGTDGTVDVTNLQNADAKAYARLLTDCTWMMNGDYIYWTDGLLSNAKSNITVYRFNYKTYLEQGDAGISFDKTTNANSSKQSGYGVDYYAIRIQSRPSYTAPASHVFTDNRFLYVEAAGGMNYSGSPVHDGTPRIYDDYEEEAALSGQSVGVAGIRRVTSVD